MNKLTHLFKIGEKVRLKDDDPIDGLHWYNGTVKEVFSDHLIIHNDDFDCDGWYEENFNLDCVYPVIDFAF